MDTNTYQVEALRTVSPRYDTSVITPAVLSGLCSSIAEELRIADEVKRVMFYGTGASEDLILVSQMAAEIGFLEGHSDVPADLVHGILGLASEVGEVVEALEKAVDANAPLDKVNLREEIGDILWYLNLLLHHLDSSFEEEMDRNIRKLRTRFPDKFTEDHAKTRDLASERAVLES